MHARKLWWLVTIISIVGLLAVAAAQDVEQYPTKPVTWVVPFDAGGGADTWTRILSLAAEDVWGQPFVVQNRPGESGVRGWRHMLSQPADGYTIVHASPTPTITLLSEENSPIQPDDVKIVGYLGTYENLIAAKPDQPWSTWEGLVEYARNNPGRLTVGGTNTPLLAVANLMDQAGIEVTIVPYSGTGAATTDFIGGHVDLLAATTTSITGLVPDEAVIVVNTGDAPLPDRVNRELEELGTPIPPSAADLGYEGLSFPRWVGVHPDTPDPLADRISDLLGELTANETVRTRIAETGEDVNFVPRAEAQQHYLQMIERLRRSLELLQ